MSASDVPAETNRTHNLISEWKPINKKTLLGVFTITLPSGMVLQGCMVHRKDGQDFVTLPGTVQMDRDGQIKRDAGGKVEYKTLIRFVSKAVYDRFQAPILEELRRLGHI